MTAVIFDLDGTLAHTAPDIHAAANAMLAERGLRPIDLPTAISFVGNGAPSFVAHVMRHHGLELDEATLRAFNRHYRAQGHRHSALYPGAQSALTELLERGRVLGVCTNKPEQPTREILARLGIDQFFKVVVGGDTLPQRKPDPAPLIWAAEQLGAGQSVFVGDSETDAATAIAARTPFLLFTEGYRKTPIGAHVHDVAFSDFAELPNHIAKYT